MSTEVRRVEATLAEIEAALRRFSALPVEALTAEELSELLDRYEFVRGKLGALEYELTNPFARHTFAEDQDA